MEEISSWRDLLGIIISDPFERERIAQQIGVHSMTLSRWVQGTSVPRAYNLSQLLQTLHPDVRKQLAELLGPLHHNPASLLPPALIAELDVRFIMEVYQTRETTPEMLHFYNISRLILQHALQLLDPESNGLSITIVKCMPPSSDGKIRSLREHMNLGTFPHQRNAEEQPMFLGAESLAGYVITQCRPQVAQKLIDNALDSTDEESVMGAPILYANRIAGCLLFVSQQPDYFQLPARRSLVSDFTHLISLAFKPNEFYPVEAVELFVMPPTSLQQQQLISFRPRVVEMMKKAAQKGFLLTVTQAEDHIWQHIESELIDASRDLFSTERADTL